jgi:hypothetical protein
VGLAITALTRKVTLFKAAPWELGGSEKVQFMKGFYDESLSPSPVSKYARKMRQAFYVDVDCHLF